MSDIEKIIQDRNAHFKESLILNPTENIPNNETIQSFSSSIHGLYISDKRRDINSKVIFGGRSAYTEDIISIYSEWKKLLGASKISMKLLSGLHSHIIVFMGLGNIGDTILLLPEQGGGHFSTKGILERLGYKVIDMIIDLESYCVDIIKTKELILKHKPKFIFVDRSEGLYYEDFAELVLDSNACCIFDASQYLTNIIAGDFINPLDMGFDIIISSLHKNFPGPQKAIVYTNKDSLYWDRVDKALDSFISNFHADKVYGAGIAINNIDFLKQYSSYMIKNALLIEKLLIQYKLPVIQRSNQFIPNHHIWLKCLTKEANYNLFKKLEQCNILVNYRMLPYNIGHGIRLGTSAATLQGLKPENIALLVEMINEIYLNKVSKELIEYAKKRIIKIKQN